MTETVVKSETIKALKDAMPSDTKIAEYDAIISLLKDLYSMHTGDESQVNYSMSLMMEISGDIQKIKGIVKQIP